MAKDKDHGKPLQYDPTFNGPLHKRSCTDIICLLLFVVFIGAWIAVGCIAFQNGDPTTLTLNVNSFGLRCGVDESVVNTPYLFYIDASSCALQGISPLSTSCSTTRVCVSQCPNKVFIFNPGSQYADIINDLYCTSGTAETLTTVEEISSAIQRGDCASWYVPSTNVAGRCLPGDSTAYAAALEAVGTLSANITQGIKLLSDSISTREIGETIVEDLQTNWPWIVGLLAGAEVVSIVYIVLLRFFAGIMVWLSLLAAVALNAYCIYACYVKYDEANSGTTSASTDDQLSILLSSRNTWLALLVLASILLCIILLVLLFLRKRLQIAIALIKEASRAVGSIKSTLAFPLFSWVLQCLIIAWTVFIAFYLISTGTSDCTNVQDGGTCSNTVVYEDYVTYLHIINIFGFLWALCFVTGLSEMMLAGTFATWYWTFKKSNVPFFALFQSMGRTMRYHLGTVAFGSLILAICKFIRLCLEYLNKKLSVYDNCFVKAVMCCLKCFFWCLEKFIKFINRNAYIMCAVHGKNFCRSARTAFKLLMRNIVRVAVLDKVTDFLLFLGKLTVTAAMMALSFVVFGNNVSGADPQYGLIPVFIVGIGSYFIASISFGVYSMAVDTLFLCFLEDLERNDGSVEKPYFMSKSLMSILGKKNKKIKNKK